MGFGAAGYLPLVALAAVPLIIHILSRLRLRRAEFPSLLLLASVQRERFSWLRLKELLLLLLRTLALLFLLLALTRPFLRVRLPGLGRAGDVVLLIDDSYSMGYGGCWQRAQAAARWVLSGMGSGQRAVVLTASSKVLGRKEDGDWRSGRAWLGRVDSLQPSHAAAGLLPVLEQVSGWQDVEVIVITDRQRRALGDTWRVPVGRQVTLVDVGSESFDNAGVTRVLMEPRFALAGRPVRFRAELANYGAVAVTRTVALHVGERSEEKVVGIPARGSVVVEFETSYQESVPTVARVELLTDSLVADDRRWRAVTPLRQVRTLVVQSPAVPARYIVSALGDDSAALFDLTVVNSAELGRQDLSRYGIVVVTDAAALAAADWARLRFGVESGVGLLVFAGTAPEDSLAGQGLVSFAGTVRSAGFATITEWDTLHPALELLRGPDLTSARIFAHARVRIGAGRVLARLSDGEPFLVQSATGSVMVLAAAPVPEGTDLVYKAAFVPLLHRTLAWLASADLAAEYLVGDTIRAVIAGDEAAVTGPSRRYAVEPQWVGGRAEILFDRTDEPGPYQFGNRLLAVNVLAEEGNLERASAAELAKRNFLVRTGIEQGASDLTVLLLYLAALAWALELLLLL